MKLDSCYKSKSAKIVLADNNKWYLTVYNNELQDLLSMAATTRALPMEQQLLTIPELPYISISRLTPFLKLTLHNMVIILFD